MRTFYFILPLWIASIIHYTSANKWLPVSETASANPAYIISATNSDSTYISLTDTAYSTSYAKGDSLQLIYKFANYSPNTELVIGFTAGDTLTDSVEVFQDYKPLAYFKTPVKGANFYDLTFSNNGVASPVRFTFTTKKKKPGTKTASKNFWTFRYFLQ